MPESFVKLIQLALHRSHIGLLESNSFRLENIHEKQGATGEVHETLPQGARLTREAQVREDSLHLNIERHR